MATYISDSAMDIEAIPYIESLAANAEKGNVQSTWYCVASCAFAACNQGKYVADIYLNAIKAYPDDKDAQRDVLRRIKESLLKTAVIYGIPRCINAFRALIKAIPDPSLNETSSIRNHIRIPAETDQRGIEYMRNIFREDLDPFLTCMNEYWPDLRTLVVTNIYGYYQSDVSVIDSVTTSQLNIATLMPMDVTAEVAWHMRGLIRNGGNREQLQYASDMASRACRITGVALKNRMPEPEEVINEERLF